MQKTKNEARAVADAIDTKDVIRLSQQLVRIPSIYHHEHRLAKFIFNKLDKWSLSPTYVPVEGFGPDVVSEFGPSNAPCVAFNGHMDTVEVMAGWKHDPFGAMIENGMLYGLGSLDMKCGIASMLTAYRAIAESGAARRIRFMFQAVTGEEDTGLGTRRLVKSGAFRGTKAVIVGEGFGGLGSITVGRRGASYYDINVKGKSAHGATPEKGINAVVDASKLVNVLGTMKMRKSREMVDDDLKPISESQTVLKIHGISDSLSVPERCYLYVVRYTIPGMKNDGDREIRKAVRSLRLRSKFDIKMKTGIHLYHPYHTDPDSALVQSSMESIRYETGSRPKLIVGLSEADDNIIAHETGIPVICFGPGEVGALARYHQPEEAVSISQIGPAARSYATAAIALADRIR